MAKQGAVVTFFKGLYYDEFKWYEIMTDIVLL